MDKKKFAKICARVGTGITVFAGTLVGGYALTPNKVRTVNLSFDSAVVDDEPTHFQQFVNKLSDYPNTGLNGLHADFDDFEIQFKTSDEGRLNDIKLDASLDLVIRSLSDLDLALYADVDYNGRELPLVVGYMDKTVYFGLKDLRLKCSSTGLNELADVVEEFFVASVEEGGLGIDPLAKFESVISEFVDNMDIGELISKFAGGETTLNTSEEELANGDWKFNLDVTMQKEEEADPTNLNIVIIVDENHDLKRVDLGTIDLGNVTIKGAIDFEIKPLNILKPDDPDNPRYNANHVYTEIVSYKGWIKKLADFLADDNQKMSISFDLGLSNGGRFDALTNLTSSVTNIGHIKGDINLDASELIDLSSWVPEEVDPYNEEDQPDFENMPSRGLRAPSNENEESQEEESLVRRVLNGIKLGLDVQIIGQNDVEYSNLSLAYLNNAGYVKFNEQEEQGVKKSVLKAKVETETFNWILDEMPNKIKELTEDMDMSALSGLFSDITESDLITSIKAGDFSGILDVVEELSNDSQKIYVVLNLSSLGLGNNAKVRLTLDSYDSAFDENYDPNHVEEHKVLDLSVENVELGDFNINFDLVNDDYQEVTIDDVESYDSLSFLPSVFDQVTGILKTKQSGFDVNVSVLDKDNLGLKIYGDGQFDYGTKYGFGSLTIDQYKYHSNQVWYSHKLALDVDDKSEDKSVNNTKFIYGDVNGKNIKGRIDIQSILDIVDVIKTFINDNKDNPKFSKFIDPIMELLGMGTIAEIIDAKDYFRFTDNSLLKEIKQYDNGQVLKIVVGGEMLGLDSDIDIRVNFDSTEDDRVINSLEVKDLVIGSAPEAGEEDTRKTLNLKLSLKDFDENKESTVPSSIPNSSFIDLSSIKLLLNYGLNTAELGYFNLRADVSLALGSLNIKTFPIVFHIVVKQSYVKVYGVIEDVPNFSVFVQDHALSTDIKSEITFETYKEGDPNKTNDVGGYFSIRKTTDPLIGKTKVYNYRSTSKNFIKGDSLLYYLLCGMLDIKKSYLDSDIGSFGSSSEEKEPGNYVEALTSTGFQYDANAKRWDVGINLGALTGIDQLDTLEASIYASEVGGKTYLTRLYAELSVKLGITLGVKADINVLNINPSATDWSSSIQTSFNKINSYVYPSGKSVLDQLNYYVYSI